MKYKLQIIKLLFLLFILSPLSFIISTVSAHSLESSNTVGAVLHVDPADDPVAGLETSGFLEFKDKEGEFSLDDCECQLEILQDSTQLFSQQLISSGDDKKSASFRYTFPIKGNYKIEVSGKSKGGNFEDFNLSYQVAVNREVAMQSTSPAPAETKNSFFDWIKNYSIYLIGAFLALTFFIATLIIKFKKNKI